MAVRFCPKAIEEAADPVISNISMEASFCLSFYGGFKRAFRLESYVYDFPGTIERTIC